MTGSDTPAAPPKGAAGLLKGMLIAQCALAGLVVLGDLPLPGFPGSGPDAPAIDTPVRPGDQTRRFEPTRLPRDLPANPNLPIDTNVPLRLEFTAPNGDGAALLNGEIAAGDAVRFADWLKGLPAPPERIDLNSPGGEVVEALEIGRIIRASGLPVAVTAGSFCFSACPYILASGSERIVSRQGYVGVHQHYFGENTYLPAFMLVSDIQTGQAEVMTYLADMGIDLLIMAKALRTPPDDIYILLPDELEAFRLATMITD
ncbi:MAG: hypothetical protein B7Y02_09465 [Rhodobacterales bacterium 17-64-5]|nr:MAG: hypothetical protein B7Y02_09465 [Rhodobacterales bacterium 17-64-5]